MKIAITGTPGVGKTRVAHELSTVLGFTHVCIAEIAKKVGAIVGKEEESFVVDTDALSQELKEMDDIIIDSHFAEMFDADFVFVLRCEPLVLRERLRGRGYSEEKIKENIMAEMLDYCLVNALEYNPPEKIFEIHENAAEEILKIVENPTIERSLVNGSRTKFLTEENLALVE